MTLAVGQRWKRTTKYAELVIEAVRVSDESGHRGLVLQIIKDKLKGFTLGQEYTWRFSSTTDTEYTYLEGQDKPNIGIQE